MARIEIDAEHLTVHVEGWDRLFALKSTLRVPLVHVCGAAGGEAQARSWWRGWRAPGTYIPGIITAGTFYAADGRAFWDVHAPGKAIVISLRDERYVKIVVGVDDPAADIARIEAAVAAANRR